MSPGRSPNPEIAVAGDARGTAYAGQRLLLVDSHSLIYRAFFALPALTDRKGRLTNAAYGFTSMLLNALVPAPDFVAAAFDHPSRTFRHDEYAQYKAQRPPTPSDLAGQFPIAKEVVRALNFAVFELEGYEADDVIGTLAVQASALGMQVSILTGDLDPLQLCSDRVDCLTTRRGISETIRYGVEEVEQRFGLVPVQMVDFKALKGDATDNIPGVPGVGEKTAIKLLQQFGTVEELLRRLDEVPAGRLRDALQQHREQIVLGKRLATIVTDLPIGFDPEVCRLKDYDSEEVRRLFQDYEFMSLVPRLPKNRAANGSAQEPRSATAVAQPGATAPSDGGGGQLSFFVPTAAPRQGSLEVEAKLVENAAALRTLLDGWPADKSVAVSLALEAAAWRRAPLAGIALADATRAWYVPLRGEQDGGSGAMLGVLRESWPRRDLTAHSLKQLELALGPRGFPPPGGFDVSLAAYLCDSRAKVPPVADLADHWLGSAINTAANVLGSGKKARLPGDLDPAEAAGLYGQEACALARLRERLDIELAAQGLHSLYYDVELPLVPCLSEMELNGVAIDVASLQAMSRELEAQVEQLDRRITDAAGHAVNVNSPPQLQKLLFEELELSVGRKQRTAKGALSTDQTVLESLREAHPVVAMILDYRQLTKLKSTYVDALPALVDAGDGRVHTSFNQTVATTGRLSSSEPNLQNIPIRTELGRRIRQAFIPGPGCVLISADYSQIELRVLAHLCGDEALTQAFAEEQDIHAVTASAVFGVPIEKVTPDQRRAAKVANFGVLYGLSEYGLQRDLGLPPEQAREFIRNYFTRFARVRGFLEGIKTQARQLGYVETILKRRRYLQDLRAANPMLRSAAERMAINMPIQGSAADILKLAMIAIRKRLQQASLSTRMILQVHDELVFDVPKKEVAEVATLVRQEMAHAYTLSVPLGVEVKSGPNWNDLKSVKS